MFFEPISVQIPADFFNRYRFKKVSWMSPREDFSIFEKLFYALGFKFLLVVAYFEIKGWAGFKDPAPCYFQKLTTIN